MTRPGVGIGVIIKNDKNEVLVGKRKGDHAPYYSIPGGHLELGETFEEAAIKEVAEESGLIITDLSVIGISNNLQTYQKEGKHYISINLLAGRFEGLPRVLEPQKCESWQWVDPYNLPQPHFEASDKAIHCWLYNYYYYK